MTLLHHAGLLVALAAVYLPALASPGPNFLAVTQAAVGGSRRQGVATALGVASGSTVQALLAATGVGLLLAHAGGVQRVVALLGGAYLLWVARAIWRQARAGAVSPGIGKVRAISLHAAYRGGLLTNLTNPKALVFFSTIFTALVGPGLPAELRFAAVALICLLSTSWHLALATLFTQPAVRAGYARARRPLLRVTSLAIGGFGVRLLWGAARG
jgi:threonine/homoserine/homoserine lactone efflux protein